MPKEFQINDLVWAKMKGYPSWPGKITAPPSGSKPKKNCHYVYFFGSENYGWINSDCIEMHSDEVLEKYKKRKGTVQLQKAVKTIVEQSKNAQSEKIIDTTTDDEPQYDAPSTSGCSSSHVKRSAKRSGSFLDLNFEDSAKDLDPPHSDAVIPHPNLMNSPVPPMREPYVERPKSPQFDFSKSESLKKKKIVLSEKKIGFLGFNDKARGIISNLSHSGHSIIMWNDTSKKCKMFADKLKVKVAATPADVIKAADIIFGCVADESTLEDHVLNSLLKEMDYSKGYVEMTTITPELSEKISTEIKIIGGLYLEAPLFGTNVEAVEGSLYVTAAGDKTLYDDCKSCFDAISLKQVYMGPRIGDAIKMNAVQNMLFGSLNVSLAEAISVVQMRGLGKEFTNMLKLSGLNSQALMRIADAMVDKNFQTESSINDMQKQFTLGLDQGNKVSQSTPVFSMANEVYKKAKKMKYGHHDISAAIQATKE